MVLQDKDAISQIADLLDEYQDRVSWLVIRNYRDTSAITMYDASKTRERLQAKGVLEIEVPCLTEITRNKLQMANLTVSKGTKSLQVHLLDRSRCQTFHDAMKAQFDRAKGMLLP